MGQQGLYIRYLYSELVPGRGVHGLHEANLLNVHRIGFYGNDTRPATFSRFPSRYMDDELGYNYMAKHFDNYTIPEKSVNLETL